MSRKIFNIKKMNKTTSIFVGVLFSTLVLASCGGKKDEATAEAGAKTEKNDDASTGADEKAGGAAGAASGAGAAGAEGAGAEAGGAAGAAGAEGAGAEGAEGTKAE